MPGVMIWDLGPLVTHAWRHDLGPRAPSHPCLASPLRQTPLKQYLRGVQIIRLSSPKFFENQDIVGRIFNSDNRSSHIYFWVPTLWRMRTLLNPWCCRHIASGMASCGTRGRWSNMDWTLSQSPLSSNFSIPLFHYLSWSEKSLS